MLTKGDFREFKKVIRLELEPVKKGLGKIKKDLNTTIKMSDRKLVEVEKRVKIIEKHIGFPEVDFA